MCLVFKEKLNWNPFNSKIKIKIDNSLKTHVFYTQPHFEIFKPTKYYSDRWFVFLLNLYCNCEHKLCCLV